MRILKARQGYIYTNGTTCGQTITLGGCDKAENWHEITEAEYEKILAEREGENL